jgi:PadR family transcriptional regulator, regulatory protein PadR
MGVEPRMTMQTLRVLKVLLDEPLAEHFGLEISRTAGLPTGSIYPILARLEQAGWLESAWEDIDPVAAGRRRRRYYKLSSDGAEKARRAVREAQQSISPTSRPRPAPGYGYPAPGGSPG